MDPFHVVAWATEALDEERRSAWNRARREAADPELARRLKHSRHALWKNPEDLTPRQQVKLAWIATNDPRLHRAYLLKEGLRTIYRIAAAEGVDAAVKALDRWLSWAVRCRLPTVADPACKIKRHYEAILHAIVEKLSNGLIESTNTKTRLMLLILGVPERVVMQIMGWSSTAMAARYQHVTGGILKDVVERVGGLIWQVAKDADGGDSEAA